MATIGEVTDTGGRVYPVYGGAELGTYFLGPLGEKTFVDFGQLSFPGKVAREGSPIFGLDLETF